MQQKIQEGSFSHFMATDAEYTVELSKEKLPEGIQEKGFIIDNEGVVALTIIQVQVQRYYEDNGYDFSVRHTYQAQTVMVAESVLEKIQITCTEVSKHRASYEIKTLK